MYDLTWFGWVLIIVTLISMMTTISMIGKPRTPTTPGVAAFSTLMNLLLIAGILFVGTGHA